MENLTLLTFGTLVRHNETQHYDGIFFVIALIKARKLKKRLHSHKESTKKPQVHIKFDIYLFGSYYIFFSDDICCMYSLNIRQPLNFVTIVVYFTFLNSFLFLLRRVRVVFVVTQTTAQRFHHLNIQPVKKTLFTFVETLALVT